MASEAAFTTVDAVAQLSFLIQSMLEREADAQGVTLGQTRLLGVLRDRTPTMNELARLLELDKSSVSGLVDRAERRGLVERVPSRTDRRSVTVQLTEGGATIVAAVAGGFAAEVDELVAGLGPASRATLTELIGRILVTHAAARGVDLNATHR